MYSELFQELGLSPNEAKIYEGMLSTEESNASRIALRSNVPRRNVYDALNRLVKNLSELATLYEAEPTTKAAYIYKGVEGYKNYHNDLLRVSQSEPVYFLGAKALWNCPQVNKSFRTNYLKEFEKRHVPYYTLFDPGVLKELPEVIQQATGEYKILPEKYATQGLVDIFGDYVITFSGAKVGYFDEHLRIFVLIDRELANTYRTWFQLIWDLLPERK